MDTITINVALLISVCGLIAAVGVAVTWIKKALSPVLKPLKEMQTSIEEVEKRTINDFNRLNEHEQILKEIQADNKEILKSVLLLLDHAETGNNTGEVAKGRKELEQYLVNR